MSVTFETLRTRAPFNKPQRFERNRDYLRNPNYRRAHNYSWWMSGVGRTMRRGHDMWQESVRHPEHKSRCRRRAHVWWRRAHRVRRAQWHTQDTPPSKSLAMFFHWMMQKHHERAFANLRKR